jgi:hypothetical protein
VQFPQPTSLWHEEKVPATEVRNARKQNIGMRMGSATKKFLLGLIKKRVGFQTSGAIYHHIPKNYFHFAKQ